MTNALSASIIESVLNQHIPLADIYVGYSGGIDSHVLLHLCASIQALSGKITAVYVHHGLQAEAESWAEHCQKTAENLQVNFIEFRVDATAVSGESPEEAARNARYAVLKPLLNADDVLLIGQHREDQLETVLLQLFRGAGLRGLSSIPETSFFGLGLMLRPMLNSSKLDIIDYAQTHQLHWIEDPSNQANNYDRNFLRNSVIPLLKQRWESCDKTVARSARHCAEAQIIVTAVADELFHPVFNKTNKTLCISQLQAHKSPRQQLIIRHWFQNLGLRMPAQAFVERIQTEVIAAREDADPILLGQGCFIRRYRDKLHCLRQSEQETPQDMHWSAEQNFIKFATHRKLSYAPSSTGILYEQWQKEKVTVKFRSGGEKIQLPNRKEHHTLKKLFQEAGIPPWERQLTPLIYLNNKLAAVGELWTSADFYHEKSNGCIRFSLQSDE
ncbi:MAG: tRNA lysidine(34) synthetase TilS [Methylococcales bacterium]|nr:tRNA lysidine(34) synthetase TilS [Methylococcales bacterium]